MYFIKAKFNKRTIIRTLLNKTWHIFNKMAGELVGKRVKMGIGLGCL